MLKPPFFRGFYFLLRLLLYYNFYFFEYENIFFVYDLTLSILHTIISNMKNYRTVNIIKQLRREARAEQLTLQEQAESVGVSTSTICRRYRTGTLLLNDFILICQKLNISPIQIIEKSEKSE